MANQLIMETRRTGDFYDTYEDTPEVKVGLERSEAGIAITVAWSHPEVPYASWFIRDDDLELSTDKDTRSKRVPKRVLFHDSHGFVLLIGCLARGYHANMSGPGSGTIWAKAAIMDVREDKEFDRPHGLQTEISGLRQWLGLSAWRETHRFNDDPRIEISSRDTTTLSVGTHLGTTLDFRTGWELHHEDESDRRVLQDIVRCTTRSVDPLDWDTHLTLHYAIRDLLVVSRWRDESCVPVRAMREDDPLTTLDEEHHGEQWRKIVVPNDARTSAPKNFTPHLIRYDDIGVDGLNHWIALREEFSRAIDPVISSITLRGTSPQTLLAHTAPGLEALGYLLMLKDGMSEKDAAWATLFSRFERILDDLGDCLPFDGEEWAEKTIANYNGLKHANRLMPDPIDTLNSWAESVMVVRAWIAVQLGIPQATVKARLADDRQPRQFTRVHSE